MSTSVAACWRSCWDWRRDSTGRLVCNRRRKSRQKQKCSRQFLESLIFLLNEYAFMASWSCDDSYQAAIGFGALTADFLSLLALAKPIFYLQFIWLPKGLINYQWIERSLAWLVAATFTAI